jgi:hypothetical protein
MAILEIYRYTKVKDDQVYYDWSWDLVDAWDKVDITSHEKFNTKEEAIVSGSTLAALQGITIHKKEIYD